jgi:hypothetical protein
VTLTMLFAPLGARSWRQVAISRRLQMRALEDNVRRLREQLLDERRARTAAEMRLARVLAAAAAGSDELLMAGWAAPALPTSRVPDHLLPHAHVLPQQE